jgi:prevent-host-death family protein
MPISEAREHLADVVNRAVYGGEITYLTRRGKRLAVVASAAQLAADQARAQQRAVVNTCEQLWESVAHTDEATRAAIRDVIDGLLALAEDAGDLAVVEAMNQDHALGSEPIPWEQVKRELEL